MLGRKPRPALDEPQPLSTVVIEARHLSKTYVMGRVRVPALREVNLRIDRGEIVAIVGPSGCGKTTLLHCLSGLEDFESGEVRLEGQSLARLSDGQKADQRARRMGFVFQSYNLLPVLNALENVELPLLLAGRSSAEARRRATRALEVVGLENRLRHRPSERSPRAWCPSSKPPLRSALRSKPGHRVARTARHGGLASMPKHRVP